MVQSTQLCFIRQLGDRQIGSLTNPAEPRIRPAPPVVASPPRRRSNKLPLSLTKVPFNATVWLDMFDPLLSKYPERIIRFAAKARNSKDGPLENFEEGPRAWGHSIRDQFGRYKFSLKGMTFDEAPLRYLDWLSGQSWLYGDLKNRLTKYMSHPIIQTMLEEIFPDPEDDSRQPAFLAQGRIGHNTVRQVTHLEVAEDDPEFGLKKGQALHSETWLAVPGIISQQRRESMPEEEQPEYVTRKDAKWAWLTIAEAFIAIEANDRELVEQEVINMADVRKACQMRTAWGPVIPPATVAKLREALRAQQQRLHERAEQNLLQFDLAEMIEADRNDRFVNKDVFSIRRKRTGGYRCFSV